MIDTKAQARALAAQQDAGAKIRAREKLAWSVGYVGQRMMWSVVAAFLIKFFTDVFGISPAAAGTLFLVARIVDAVNDPLTGYIIDRIPWTAGGKLRRVLLVGAFLSAIGFVALFAAPQLSMTGKLIYAYVTYLFWGIAFDFVEIPTNALLPTMTQNAQDRARLSSLGMIVRMLGFILIAAITLPIVATFATPQAGWRATTAIYAVVAVALTLITVVGVRERVRPVKVERYPATRAFGIILRNTPLLMMLGCYVFFSISTTLVSSSAVYYFEYAVGRPQMFGTTSMVTALFMTIAAALFPAIAKRWGKRKTYIVFGLAGFLASIARYLVPYDNIVLIYVTTVIFGTAMGPAGALHQALVADTTDYAEWQNGFRSEGVIYAAISFGTKLTAGLAGAVQGYVLAATGYVPNVTQNPLALQGITALMTLAVGVSLLISALFIVGYPLTEARHAQILQEIKARQQPSG